MNDLNPLIASSASAVSALAAGSRPNAAIEEVVVKGDKQEDEGFTFFDFLDVINPLQHIPVVNTIYREMTGDEIKAPAKMIGSAILGGPVGLAVAMVDTAIEDSTGKDMGGHAMAFFKDEAPAAASAVVAVAATASPEAAQTTVKQATSAREFIPALNAAAASSSAMPASLIEDGTKDEAQQNADELNQQTAASIAASAAAAPQGLVFMPLPGRQGAAFKPASAGQSSDRFMAIDRTGLSNRPSAEPVSLAQLQAQSSFRPGPFGSNTDQVQAMLDATKPQGDTGRMPTADPLAAARMMADESGPAIMPAWFDAAMSVAIDKYKAMQGATP